METIYWLPYYKEIIRDLEIDPGSDIFASNVLSDLLSKNHRIHDRNEVIMELERSLEGRDVYIFGAGPDLEIELDRLVEEKRSRGRWTGSSTGNDILIAADGATSVLMSRSLIPQVIVTDLDGGVEDQLRCLSRGSVIVVHAHGDNIQALRDIVPRMFGSILGTTQADPGEAGGLDNFGGFTDGDRAAFLAQHFMARSITLLGFNFSEMGPKIGDGGMRMESMDPEENEFKFKKLAWANLLLGLISNPQVQLYSGDPIIRL
ncbi:MAG: 6-hydroxymethylpterin diphosphokinase MptE-like protein [Thermoplasmatota archaeon]